MNEATSGPCPCCFKYFSLLNNMVFELSSPAQGRYVATADTNVLYDGIELRAAISTLATKLNTKKVKNLTAADRQITVSLNAGQAAAIRASIGQHGASTVVELSVVNGNLHVLLSNNVLLTKASQDAIDVVAALRLWRKELYRKKNMPTVALGILAMPGASSSGGGSTGGNGGGGHQGGIV